ncbi:MAG TPA: helix-turn-helix domain-containing protein [Spirochaetia bacterium]|nr:helix-turn-helix domain-containing protein [Spirochaetia bacterium]
MSLSVSILALRDCTPLAPIGPMEVLAMANRLQGQKDGGGPPFRIRLVSPGGNPVMASNGYPLHCHATIASVRSTDLVIIPAMDGDIQAQMDANRSCVPWIRRMYGQGADVVSICTGAFLLAETGLLDGKSATTHWVAQDLFRRRYPKTHLVPEQIVVDNGRICTSGGATSFLTLSIYLVEKYCGAETARLVSKMFLIDINKGPQTAYAIFGGQKAHSDEEILKAQMVIEEEGSRELTVAEIATRVAMSPRNFIRRFKRATGNKPIEYLQRVRVEQAKRALEAGSDAVSEIADRVGYHDAGSFRRIFRRVTGVTPAEYRSRYRYYGNAPTRTAASAVTPRPRPTPRRRSSPAS